MLPKGKWILVIDDEELIREVVQACLEDLGEWQVVVAASGAEGLAQLGKTRFDAVLLDISMPDKDGFQFFEELQQAPIRDVPVVLLTAKALPADQGWFDQMGVAGIITKPFDPLTLCDQVATILGWTDT